MAISSELRRPCSRDARAQRVPARGVRRASTPQASNCSSPRAARVSAKAGWAPFSLAPARTRPTARGSRSPPEMRCESARASGASNGRRSWKNTSCRPITPRPTGRQRWFERSRRGDRVVVEVDHAVELAHRACARCARASSKSNAPPVDRRRGAPRLIEPRLQTAVSSSRRDLEDLGAQVREVHDVRPAAPVWLHARLRLVLERHPAVAGLGQRAHHPRVELARLAPSCAARPARLGLRRRRARTSSP